MHDLAVASRYEQPDGRGLEVRVFEDGREEMSLHVVDTHERQLARPSGGLAERVADQQRPDETRALGGSYRIEVVGMDPCLDQGPVGERPDRLDVGACGDLGNHSAEPGVQLDL